MVLSVSTHAIFVCACIYHNSIVTLVKNQNSVIGKTKEKEQQLPCSLMKTVQKTNTQAHEHSSHNHDSAIAE